MSRAELSVDINHILFVHTSDRIPVIRRYYEVKLRKWTI